MSDGCNDDVYNCPDCGSVSDWHEGPSIRAVRGAESEIVSAAREIRDSRNDENRGAGLLGAIRRLEEALERYEAL